MDNKALRSHVSRICKSLGVGKTHLIVHQIKTVLRTDSDPEEPARFLKDVGFESLELFVLSHFTKDDMLPFD